MVKQKYVMNVERSQKMDLQKMQEKMRYTAYTTLDKRRQALNERNERIRNTRNH